MTVRFFSRRSLLTFGASVAGIVTTVAQRSFAAAAGACVDLNSPSSNKSLRESLNFTEKAADPKTSCGTCSFFIPGKKPCGDCMIFSGPANEAGHCDSWGPKQG